jgi:hypothetical protein
MAGWTSLHVGCARFALFEQPAGVTARVGRRADPARAHERVVKSGA